jgi:20S proteasome alpha/beta subunit
MLGDHEFSSILYQIREAQLETDFLVAGFGPDGVPRIFTVGDPGTEYIHDAMAYHAIGCGAPLADAALMASFNPMASLPDIIYRVMEAKFLSEAAPGVGKSTFVNTLDQQGKIQCIYSTEAEKMRKFWENSKRPAPAKAKEAIKKILTDEHPFRA